MATKTRVVPFPRPLAKGMSGMDVTAVKRAWRRYDETLISNRTRVYGDGAVRAERKFERKKALPVDGAYEAVDHAKLSPYFDAYGVWLMTQAKAKAVEKPQPRKQLAAAALALRHYQITDGRVHYTQSPARMTIVRRRLTIASYAQNPNIYEDCSSSVTGYFWQCRLPDPNGFGYNGQGYTGTLAQHGVRVDQPFPGDLIFYGRGFPYSHVTIAVGDDPFKPASRCISHGHEGGPQLLSIWYRSDVRQFRSYLPRS